MNIKMSVAIGWAGAMLAASSVLLPAHAGPLPPDPGPHGCILSDPALPVLHDSDTSHIGGKSCTYHQIGASGGGYGGVAGHWQISWCRRVPTKKKKDLCKVLVHKSGSGPVYGVQGSIPEGVDVTVKVTQGFIFAGTPSDT